MMTDLDNHMLLVVGVVAGSCLSNGSCGTMPTL